MVSVGLAHFAEFELQLIALTWMAILYAIKAYQLAHLPMPWEKGPPKGSSPRLENAT